MNPNLIIVLHHEEPETHNLSSWLNTASEIRTEYTNCISSVQLWYIGISPYAPDLFEKYTDSSRTPLVTYFNIGKLETNLDSISADSFMDKSRYLIENGLRSLPSSEPHVIYFDQLSSLIPSTESIVEEILLMNDVNTQIGKLQETIYNKNNPILNHFYSKSQHASFIKNDPSNRFYDVERKSTRIYQSNNLFVVPSSPDTSRSFRNNTFKEFLWFLLLNWLLIAHGYKSSFQYFAQLIYRLSKAVLWFLGMAITLFLKLSGIIIFGFFQALWTVTVRIVSRSYFKSFSPKANLFLDDFIESLSKSLNQLQIIEYNYWSLTTSPDWIHNYWGRGKYYPSILDFTSESLYYNNLSKSIPKTKLATIAHRIKSITASEMLPQFMLQSMLQKKSNQILFIESSYDYPSNSRKHGIPYIIQIPIDSQNDFSWSKLIHNYKIILQYSSSKYGNSALSYDNIIWYLFLTMMDFVIVVSLGTVLLRRMSFWNMMFPILLTFFMINVIYTHVILWNIVDIKKQNGTLKRSKKIPTSILEENDNWGLYIFTQSLFPILWFPVFICQFFLAITIYIFTPKLSSK